MNVSIPSASWPTLSSTAALTPESFSQLRYGLFVHYGLYSLLASGEWVMNRQRIAPGDYRQLADRFTAEHFDADQVCDLAVSAGMRYVVFTTMHHDGFRLYDTGLSDFNSVRSACRRDLTAEMVAAARRRGLRIGLYHSLNNWMEQPDGVAALEQADARQVFIERTHQRVEELARRYNPVDIFWYDGWWPFNADGWQSQRMNQTIRNHQPHILFNGRNGLAGDFATPEGHLGAPDPWRSWEACITLNNSWGYHAGDHDWKSPQQVVDMLATVANQRGNLLLNVGPRGDGSIPQPSSDVLLAVGQWLRRCGQCVDNTDCFTVGLQERNGHRSDWSHHGPFTASGNNLYLLLRRWPGRQLVIAGLQARVLRAQMLAEQPCAVKLTQMDDKLTIDHLPELPPDPVCPVLHLECDRPPELYLTGGMRIPRVTHPPYDPCPSDLLRPL